MNNKITWNDITLGEFIEIQNIIKSEELNEIDKKVELMKILTKNDKIDELPVLEFNKYAPILNILNSPIPKVKIKKEYELNGNKYKTTKSVSELTTGQFIDYQNLLKNGIELEDLSTVISYLLIPEGYSYAKGYLTEDVKSDVESYMSIVDVYSCSDFFINALRKSLKVLRGYFQDIILGSEMTTKEKIKLMIHLRITTHKLRGWLSTD